MHSQGSRAFSLTYLGYMNLNIKITHFTRSFVTWYTVEYSEYILQHNSLANVKVVKDSVIILLLRNTTYYILRDLQFM